jgi:enamine deaminase RidA (YjgF/YER057c/UK114 family)
MEIKRLQGAAKGRSRAVVHGGLVYTVATGAGADVAEQTRATLASIDRNLGDAGTDRTRILRTTIYLRDMATKEEMDAVWRDWIGAAENWPQRACVGADLAGGDLVEIVVTAAAPG